MHSSSARHAIMNKENRVAAKVEESAIRITRARAKALGTSGGILTPSKPSIKEDQKKHALRANSKRVALDENKPTVNAPVGSQHKRRAVLKDVTNTGCENAYVNCINAAKIQPSKQAKRATAKRNSKVAPISSEIQQVKENTEFMVADEISKAGTVEPQKVNLPKLKEYVPIQHSLRDSVTDFGVVLMPVKHATRRPAQLQIPSNKDELCDKLGAPIGLGIANLDSNQKDPQMCSPYASDIYNHIRVTELERKPSANFMDTVQRDINQSMRGILVDWLVEVSEEYKLVPDTLYLTVNLIDRFLSQNYIEKQRLQLLGVTCMLIASKYEEICAPRVEEFCFITDNTYSKGEVLEMESKVLNFLHFHLSVPTTKTFLRRTIQAAQACYKAPCVELEFLANYLAELTLTEYSFLKFLPSLIAASAVFLARWTLDQSDHPWNATLEHYTSYKAPELKTAVLAIHDLQLNTNGCSLNAIREKYRQDKFKCVATLSPGKSVETLF